jgi:hypothetical protein
MAPQREKDRQHRPADRDARLAAALRENLRRRKAQARGRGPKAADARDAEKAPGERNPKG